MSNPADNTEAAEYPRQSPSNKYLDNGLSNPNENNPLKKSKVPAFMKSSLKKKQSQIRQSRMMDSTIADMLVNVFMMSKTKCGICEEVISKEASQALYMCNCPHKDNFCESCLHHYTIFKINSFQKVQCPDQECNSEIDMNGELFKQLPNQIQKKFKKMQQFFLIQKDNSKRLCPQQDCDGVVTTTENIIAICDRCKSEFCPKCFLKRHQGDCESFQKAFFENNLHYRQCKKCNFIIEKNQGCNHMTCRCGHQFCYVCGEEWSQPHYGQHDQNGNLRPVANSQPQSCPCDCQNFFRCCGCRRSLGECLTALIRFPFRFAFLLFLWALATIYFIFKDLIVILLSFPVSILAGLFVFSFQLLFKCKGAKCILGVIFFPILMVVGIVGGFSQITCKIAPERISSYCSLLAYAARKV